MSMLLEPLEPSLEELDWLMKLRALEMRIATLENASRQVIKHLDAAMPHDGQSSQRIRWAKAILADALEGG